MKIVYKFDYYVILHAEPLSFYIMDKKVSQSMKSF
jgi:hypothetical protein